MGAALSLGEQGLLPRALQAGKQRVVPPRGVAGAQGDELRGSTEGVSQCPLAPDGSTDGWQSQNQAGFA